MANEPTAWTYLDAALIHCNPHEAEDTWRYFVFAGILRDDEGALERFKPIFEDAKERAETRPDFHKLLRRGLEDAAVLLPAASLEDSWGQDAKSALERFRKLPDAEGQLPAFRGRPGEAVVDPLAGELERVNAFYVRPRIWH
ncbi:MAG: hypothetical protein ACYTFT_13360, partial [Planctomycetota bacterium]